MIIDISGTVLIPGNSGKDCPGNGCDETVECCCNACDYFLCCIDETYPDCCADCNSEECPRKSECLSTVIKTASRHSAESPTP